MWGGEGCGEVQAVSRVRKMVEGGEAQRQGEEREGIVVEVRDQAENMVCMPAAIHTRKACYTAAYRKEEAKQVSKRHVMRF